MFSNKNKLSKFMMVKFVESKMVKLWKMSFYFGKYYYVFIELKGRFWCLNSVFYEIL